MAVSWNFDEIKLRIQSVAKLAREGTEVEAGANYFRGLDTELKALRAWVDVDKEQRGQREIEDLRVLVTKLDDRVAKLHASGGDARATDIARPGAARNWRQ